MKKVMLFAMVGIFSLASFAQTVKAKDPQASQVQSGERNSGDKKMSEIKISELPKAATAYISKNIPGGTIKRAGKIVENGVITYVAVVINNDRKNAFLFDKNGNFTGKGDHLFKGKGQGPRKAEPGPKK